MFFGTGFGYGHYIIIKDKFCYKILVMVLTVVEQCEAMSLSLLI